MMLKVSGISAHYGMIQALEGLSLEVHEGEIVSIIGANGAGKSTLLRNIIGLHKPTTGEVHFMGERIDRLRADAIIK